MAVLVAVYDIGRSVPDSYSCDGAPGPRHDELVAAFQVGATGWHLLAIGACMAAVACLSAARADGGFQAPGNPTAIALLLLLMLLPFALVSDWFGLLPGALALLIAAPGLLLAHPNAGALAAFVIAAFVIAIPFLFLDVLEGKLRRVAGAVWWLLAFAAGHLLLIRIAGHGPIAC